MDLPTYTNIWRIEKRLYKLYDLRLPMPLPIVWIGVFVGVMAPWSLLLALLGLPFDAPWHVLYLVPPGVVTWLSTRPVIESKRLTELLQSQIRYMGEPRTWCRMAPASEPSEITLVAKVWRAAPEETAEARDEVARRARSGQIKRASASPRQVRPAVAAAAAAVAATASAARERVGRGAETSSRRGTAPALDIAAPAERPQTVAGAAPVVPAETAGRGATAASAEAAGRLSPAASQAPATSVSAASADSDAPIGTEALRRLRRFAAAAEAERAASFRAEPPTGPEAAGPSSPARRSGGRSSASEPVPAKRPSERGASEPAPAAERRTDPVASGNGSTRPSPAAPSPAAPRPVAASRRAAAPPVAASRRAAAARNGSPVTKAPEGTTPPKEAPRKGADTPRPDKPVKDAPPLDVPLSVPRAVSAGETPLRDVPEREAPRERAPVRGVPRESDPAKPAESAPVQRREEKPEESAPVQRREEKPAARSSDKPVPGAQPPGKRVPPGQTAGRQRVRPPGVSIRAVSADSTASGPVAPAVPVPRPPQRETRVRRVESVVGRDSAAGGWRRLAQVVIGPGGGRTDGSEIDETRARGAFTGSRRVVVLGCTGGAGQTTTALMLGHTLARHREDRILAVDANAGAHTLSARVQAESPETLTSLLAGLDNVHGYLGMRAYTSRCASGLEILAGDTDSGAEQRLSDRTLFSDRRLGQTMEILDRHYKLIVVDPAAALAARVLPFADQLVLVVPANEDAPDAVAMTYEWLDGHGCADLRRRAVLVVNGVSRRSMSDVEQAEAVARGRCRAIVRVPWEDELAPGRSERVEPSHLRAAGRRAYLALAGVVVAGFGAGQAVRPSEEEVAQ